MPLISLKESEYLLVSSKGNEYFGIKPYPVLIVGLHVYADEVLMLNAYTDFEVKGNVVDLAKARLHQYCPTSIKHSEQYASFIRAKGFFIRNYRTTFEEQSGQRIVQADVLKDFMAKRRENLTQKVEELKQEVAKPSVIPDASRINQMLALMRNKSSPANSSEVSLVEQPKS